MNFAETFIEHASKTPTLPFLSHAGKSISFSESLKAIQEMDIKEAEEISLSENSIRSVIGWLAIELLRGSSQKEAPVDFVRTSGSTGKPKTFFVSLESQLVTANAINSQILKNQSFEELIVLPLTHSSARGRLRAAVLRGARIHLASHPFSFRTFSPDAIKRPYSMAITPTTFRYLQQRLGEGFWEYFRLLKSVEFGSAELRESEQAKLLREAPSELEICMHYGLSEASRSFLRNVRLTPSSSLGDPMPHTKYRLAENGELVISGPHIATREISSDGEREMDEVHTGDLCENAPDGRIFLIGRQKNTINCGGFTLFAERLESELSMDPSLANLAIGRAPHELLGEIPVLFVPHGKKEIALEAWTRLAINIRSAVLPEIYEIAKIPSLSSGKIDRQALNDLAEREFNFKGGNGGG